MRDARLKAEWGQTAQLSWLIVETNAASKDRRPTTPEYWNPYEDQIKTSPATPKPDAMVPITALKDVFIDGKWPELDEKNQEERD